MSRKLNLTWVFESFVRINQLNGKGTDNSQKLLAMPVNGAMKKEIATVSKQLLQYYMMEMVIDSLPTKGKNVEEQQIL